MGPIHIHVYLWMVIVYVVGCLLSPTTCRPPLEAECPYGCMCNDIVLQVNCNNADLGGLPSIRNNTRVLFFEGNQLRVIERQYFALMGNLRSLSLADNVIDEIQEDSFVSQRKMIRLDLSGNRFGEVPVALRHLRILKELDLRDNQIRTLSKEPWSNLTRLTLLRLDNNSIPNLPMVMTSKLKRMINLSISYNEITAIPSGQFLNTSSLVRLDLSYNLITTNLDTASNAASYNYLPSYAPTAATEEEYQADDMAEGITVESLKGLVSLIELNLAGNKIKRLENGVFTDLINLEILNMDDNGLEHIQELVFREQYKLRILSMSQNALEVLPQSLFEDLRQLQVLNLDSNRIFDISPLTNVHMFHLIELKLNNNAIDYIDPRGFEGYIAIEQIFLQHNKLKHVPEVRNLSRLNTINLSNNRIRKITPVNAFEGTSLIILNLEYNRLQSLDRSTFKFLSTLRVIRMDGNKYVCDCQIQWIVEYYDNYPWMDTYEYGTVEKMILCQAPSLVYGMNVYEGFNYARGLTCTEYAEPHRVMLLVVGWGGLVIFTLLAFWLYTYFDYKKRFYVRKPSKRYLLLHNGDNNDSIPLTGEHSKVRFRTFDSDTDSYIYDEETTV